MENTHVVKKSYKNNRVGCVGGPRVKESGASRLGRWIGTKRRDTRWSIGIDGPGSRTMKARVDDGDDWIGYSRGAGRPESVAAVARPLSSSQAVRLFGCFQDNLQCCGLAWMDCTTIPSDKERYCSACYQGYIWERSRPLRLLLL